MEINKTVLLLPKWKTSIFVEQIAADIILNIVTRVSFFVGVPSNHKKATLFNFKSQKNVRSGLLED